MSSMDHHTGSSGSIGHLHRVAEEFAAGDAHLVIAGGHIDHVRSMDIERQPSPLHGRA